MKTVGRIILLVVGGLMIALAITDFIDAFKAINSYWGWSQFLKILTDATARQYLAKLFKASIMIIVSASALFAGIKGKGGFWFTAFSVAYLAMFIWTVVSMNKAGSFAGTDKWKNIWKLICDSAIQLGYISGFILLKLSKE